MKKACGDSGSVKRTAAKRCEWSGAIDIASSTARIKSGQDKKPEAGSELYREERDRTERHKHTQRNKRKKGEVISEHWTRRLRGVLQQTV